MRFFSLHYVKKVFAECTIYVQKFLIKTFIVCIALVERSISFVGIRFILSRAIVKSTFRLLRMKENSCEKLTKNSQHQKENIRINKMNKHTHRRKCEAMDFFFVCVAESRAFNQVNFWRKHCCIHKQTVMQALVQMHAVMKMPWDVNELYLQAFSIFFFSSHLLSLPVFLRSRFLQLYHSIYIILLYFLCLTRCETFGNSHTHTHTRNI